MLVDDSVYSFKKSFKKSVSINPSNIQKIDKHIDRY